jgi:NodT family efflux transporter outer membrane factor (OMF) lipoprotein
MHDPIKRGSDKRGSDTRGSIRRDLKRIPAVALLTVALAACAVGPDHVRPTLPVPGQFARAATETVADGGNAPATDGTTSGELHATPDANAEFWQNFNDPLLTRLVEEALLANHDLRIALANYDRANALLRNAKFDRYPTITANATASDGRSSADQAPGVSREDRDAESYDAGIDASWELDLFGRVRRGVESQRAEAMASAADLDALQVAIVGEVVRTYVELRGQQARLQVARENADNQAETLRLVDARLDAGRGTEFDTARARAQHEATLARLPALEAVVAVSMHRLAVLTGQVPQALIAELEPSHALPALPARLDPGTPGELLRRRPDVIAAEERLHAATARIGVATADLFPRFTLGGLIGSQAIDSSALFERDSETRLVALGIDWSFLDIGRVRARIAAADADAAGELARYQQTVLLALEDTENALVRYARAREEDRHLERAARDSTRAAELARVRFDAGATDLLEVLDAERTQLQAQDAFADGRTRSVTGAVALYRALAGGWPSRLPMREDIARRQP